MSPEPVVHGLSGADAATRLTVQLNGDRCPTER